MAFHGSGEGYDFARTYTAPFAEGRVFLQDDSGAAARAGETCQAPRQKSFQRRFAGSNPWFPKGLSLVYPKLLQSCLSWEDPQEGTLNIFNPENRNDSGLHPFVKRSTNLNSLKGGVYIGDLLGNYYRRN